MVYEIRWTVIASKQFDRLDRTIQKRITEQLASTRENPFVHASRLVGFDAYKIRIGDYRIIVSIERNMLVILVLKVGHRKSVYK